MPDTNFMKETLAAGKAAVGTWCVLPAPGVTDVLARAGMDFVVIDREHGPISFETAECMVRAAELSGCSPLVRVPGLDEGEILRALDIGAHGVIVPNVKSLEQAREAVAATKYAPAGARGFSPYTRGAGYSHHNVAPDHQVRANRNTLLILLIEGPDGLAAQPDILNELGEWIDVLYVGVYDLANTMGLPGQVDHPDVIAATGKAFAQMAEHDVAAGTLVRTPAEVTRYAGLGARMLAYQGDVGILTQAATEIVSETKRLADAL